MFILLLSALSLINEVSTKGFMSRCLLSSVEYAVSPAGQDGPDCVGTCSLKFAIENSSNGDTLMLSKGRFDIASLAINSKFLTIHSASADRAVVDGRNENPCFIVHRATVVFSDISIENCVSDYGGAILSRDSTVQLQAVELRNNKAHKAGGGIFWTRRPPLLERCSFSSNSAAYGPDIASSIKPQATH